MTNDRSHRHRSRPADADRAAGERTRAQAGPGGHRGVVVQVGLGSQQGVGGDHGLRANRRPCQHDGPGIEARRGGHRRRRVHDDVKHHAGNAAGEPLGDRQPGVVVANADDDAVDAAVVPPGGDQIGATDDRHPQDVARRTIGPGPVIDDGDHLKRGTRLGRIDNTACVPRTPDHHHATHGATVEHRDEPSKRIGSRVHLAEPIERCPWHADREAQTGPQPQVARTSSADATPTAAAMSMQPSSRPADASAVGQA